MKNSSESQSRWPVPEFENDVQPHFLFFITPPFSGSTALSQIINTSHRTMILQRRGEGQWLVPGMCENDRWNPEKDLDYLSIKATWLNTYQNVARLVGNIDVVIEKSPPNMMRLEKLASHFREYSFIASNRDPYANCASILDRYRAAGTINPRNRKEMLSRVTKDWVVRSEKIKELIAKLNVPLLTYEKFCANPSAVKTMLNIPSGVSESINTSASVKVKGSEPKPITNHNERQVSTLTAEDKEHISKCLKSNKALVEHFGYQVLI